MFCQGLGFRVTATPAVRNRVIKVTKGQFKNRLAQLVELGVGGKTEPEE